MSWGSPLGVIALSHLVLKQYCNLTVSMATSIIHEINNFTNSCQMEFEGQLAVAKSEKALMSLAQFISNNEKNYGEFYWIGLSEK